MKMDSPKPIAVCVNCAAPLVDGVWIDDGGLICGKCAMQRRIERIRRKKPTIICYPPDCLCCDELAGELYDPDVDEVDSPKRFTWDPDLQQLWNYDEVRAIDRCPYCGARIEAEKQIPVAGTTGQNGNETQRTG